MTHLPRPTSNDSRRLALGMQSAVGDGMNTTHTPQGDDMRIDNLTIERLVNGLIMVQDLGSKSRGTFNADGTFRHGHLNTFAAREAVRTFIASR